jgi:RNA polymerase sigma-70 factor (ECF subfamily)
MKAGDAGEGDVMVLDKHPRPGRSDLTPDEELAMQEVVLERETVAGTESNRDKFISLVKAHEKELYNFAYRLTGNRHDAEDLLQESFFKAYKYYFQLRDESKFKEWIFQITANQFKNLLRKKRRERLSFPEDFEKNVTETIEHPPIHNPDERYDRRDHSALVQEAISELGPKMRTVLVLFELEGYSIEDISSMLGISRGTVKSRLHYARRKLKEVLLSEDYVERHHYRDMESDDS